MSTKRGRRNGKWHKEKANRRLQELRDELWSKSEEKEYIPLEKPIFAGWDVSISVEGFRRDRHEIEAVIKAVGWAFPFFIRNISNIRELRKDNYSFYTFLKIRKSYYGYNSTINLDTYQKLPESIKKYFHKTYITNLRSILVERYELNWNFPFYALKVNVKKSYYKYKIIYNTVAQSESDKLDNRLYLVDCKKWGSRYRDSFVRTNKTHWKNAMRTIVTNQYTPDEVIDNYCDIFKNVNNKRDYGWS